MKISSWLIIFTIGISSVFSGCSTSAVKRKLPSLAQFERSQPKEDKKTLVPETQPVREEETAFKSDTALEPMPTGKRLPTLREQMQKIAESQAAITTRHSEISEDVIVVKQDVAQMKESLEDIKSALNEMRGAKTQSFSKGGESEIQPDVPATRVLKSTRVSEEILPDDVADETFEENVIQPDNFKEKKPARKKKISVEPVVKENAFKEKATRQTAFKKEVKITADEKKAAVQTANPAQQPMYATAMSLFKKRNFSEAITLLESLLKTEKSPAVASNCHYWIGESHFGLGQFSQAIASFKKVMSFKNAEKSDDAQRMIAEAYVKGGNIAEARRAFQRLIDTNPDSDLVPLARKKLQQL